MAVSLVKPNSFNHTMTAPDAVDGVKNTMEQVKLAISLYKSHSMNGYLDMLCTQEFVPQLCKESWFKKYDLRQMLRKSQYWNEELQCCIIPSKQVLRTDCGKVFQYMGWLLKDTDLTTSALSHINEWLVGDHHFWTENEFIDWWNRMHPNTIHKGAKKTRVLRKMLIQLNVWNDKAGSRCQEYFSKVCDELNPKTRDITYYLSINPAHILTQSNPKNDDRGEMLTSCHSLNNMEHEYSNGCAGYAMDGVTMILFRAATPDADGRCTRKTMRQFFYYQQGSGVILQSRLYDSCGGTRGHQAESDKTLKLVQGIIAGCENIANNWNTYEYSHSYDARVRFDARPEFGGYTDWYYTQFDPRISFHASTNYTYSKVFHVGSAGICFICGGETEPGDSIYCSNCKPHDYCDSCGNVVHYEDDLTWVHDSNGNPIRVCEICLGDYYRYCYDCEEYHHYDDMYETVDNELICSDCFERNYVRCEECGLAVPTESAVKATNNGSEVWVCEECADNSYVSLWDGELVHYKDQYHDCPCCGELVAGSDDEELCGDCEQEEGAE